MKRPRRQHTLLNKLTIWRETFTTEKQADDRCGGDYDATQHQTKQGNKQSESSETAILLVTSVAEKAGYLTGFVSIRLFKPLNNRYQTLMNDNDISIIAFIQVHRMNKNKIVYDITFDRTIVH